MLNNKFKCVKILFSDRQKSPKSSLQVKKWHFTDRRFKNVLGEHAPKHLDIPHANGARIQPSTGEPHPNHILSAHFILTPPLLKLPRYGPGDHILL